MDLFAKLLFKSAVAILIFLFCTSFSVAEIYKWTDENGQVHFSEKPNAELDNEIINLDDKDLNTIKSIKKSKKDSFCDENEQYIVSGFFYGELSLNCEKFTLDIHGSKLGMLDKMPGPKNNARRLVVYVDIKEHRRMSRGTADYAIYIYRNGYKINALSGRGIFSTLLHQDKFDKPLSAKDTSINMTFPNVFGDYGSIEAWSFDLRKIF